MYVIEQLANRLAKKIVEQGSPQPAGAIAHGIELVMLNILNVIFVLFVAYYAGFFTEAAMASIGYMVYRAFSGGGHLKGPWRCFAFGNVSLLGLSWLAKVFTPEHPVLPAVTVGISFLFSFVANYKYAPISGYGMADEQKQINRRILFVLLSLGALISNALLWTGYSQAAYAFSFAVVYQGLLLLPPVNFFLKRL